MIARSAILALLLGLLAACESAPVTGRSQMMLVSESEERQLGLQAYRQVVSSEPASHNPAFNAMVERVGRRIADAAERPPGEMWRAPRFQWEFRTIDKNMVNAFCLPGGKVAVYTGLMPIAQTEAGLAVVMGHEVAHALAHHGAERMSNQMAASVGAAAVATTLAATVGGRNRTYMPLIAGALGAGATYGFLLPMSREQESEADRIGLVLMAMAGYDPREGVALWERMRAANARQAKQAEWMSTHPADTTRINDIRTHLPETMKFYRPR